MVAHTFNPSTREAERRISEFEANLVYKVSSRTARATQRNPDSGGGRGGAACLHRPVILTQEVYAGR
jgi:hypothetical protein